jgi:DNA-binding MarR family transcriptional regulator
MTPRELAGHEKVQPPSMTRVVAFLEGRGLLARAPHPTDRRQVVLTPTPAGRALLAEHRAARQAWLTERLRELTPVEIRTLERAAPILERLSRA